MLRWLVLLRLRFVVEVRLSDDLRTDINEGLIWVM